MSHHDYGNQACPVCEGKGALKPTNGRNEMPAYWFETNATHCQACEGTGERK